MFKCEMKKIHNIPLRDNASIFIMNFTQDLLSSGHVLLISSLYNHSKENYLTGYKIISIQY